ncbi:conserved hypothetical protein [Flavobacterium sp. 9AF]|uniref:hypothetical protein n=1 Tax=Flavobacterium sp. 9AF TaxID=2653142 RepID=UPI0012EFE304|nr:hypothetical protein [Flavobacterium sp. 9AF]VXB18603.1 conserved hypothetical protein [Flavobacterium sp. 9AF]
MITNDYLRVAEVAKEKNITTRTVRNKIKKLIGVVGDNKIIRESNEEYRIHKSIINMFEPERVHQIKYSAITIDPIFKYTVEDLKKIMDWIMELINEDEVEINYSIEQKKANGNNHLHIYTEKSVSTKFLKCAKFAIPKMSYHIAEVYDLEGWKSYMQKETDIIKLLKKNEKNEKNN